MDEQKHYVHTMEYYSAVKRNEGLIHATTGTNIENIILSERNWSTYDMIPFI